MDNGKPNNICDPCEEKATKAGAREIKMRLLALPGWTAVEDHHLFKSFPFPDFKSALAFVNKIGAVAEEEGHHPDITFTWGKVDVSIFTHALNGLSENDFLLAEMIEGIQNH